LLPISSREFRMSNKICLVVSNCKSCWDTSSKLAFISDSVPDYLGADELKLTNSIVLNGPWESHNYRIKSHQFVIERVARYRKELLPILNSSLGISYGEKAWGILLDSWLLHFTSVVYDRVNKLENAQKQLEDIFLKCPERGGRPVATTLEFVHGCLKDPTNQQLFCDVAQALGIEIEHCVDSLPEDECLPDRTEKESLTSKVYSMASPFFRWWVQYRKALVIVDGFSSPQKAILILLRSLGGILIIPSRMFLEKLPDLKVNIPLRKLLKVVEKDKYDLVANELFAKYFPLSLLEGLKGYSEKISKLGVIPVLGAAGSFYFNEEYKILASQVIENGNKVVGFQHGGNYNFQKDESRPSEFFEKLNADKFYQWKGKSFSGKYLPIQKLRLISAYKEARKKKTNFTDVLFVSTAATRYIFRFETESSDEVATKIIAQQNFYLRLDRNISKNFLLRPHPVDYGWRYKERWIDFTEGKIRFDPNKRFYDSLVSCKVFVSDHISTTWLEAFYCDAPVILFFDLERYFVVDEVKPLFEELQAVGIYHPTAESAASFLNEKYETIEEWWQMPETKAAADKVRNYFFTDTLNHFTKEWTQELVALREKTMRDKVSQGEIAKNPN
jgi:putative transferase (TIGR04331 family)